ncbi:undecaprenyl-diphosphatase 3 [Clostridia bacterium]|nr:undecaprenyl-diphosphatase 3 [Clostridia bacterium]
MTTWQAVILGALQGLAEFLPISSSGHLLIGERLMGLEGTGLLLEILLHVGTLAAVVIVFWRDFIDIITHPVKDKRFVLLVVATIPAVVAALFFDDLIERLFTGWFLGISFLITGILLFVGESFAQRRRAHEDVRMPNAIAMGLMQAFAILPGVSRSGSTIVGGVASGVTREGAARFSFMMSAVAIVGSVVFKLPELMDASNTVFQSGWTVPVVGMLTAAIVGYLAIRFMLRLLNRGTLKGFAWYVAAVGVLVVLDQVFFGRFFPKMF